MTEATCTDCAYQKLAEEEPASNDNKMMDCSIPPESQQPNTNTAMPFFASFKNHSLIIGLLVGFFVQFSTLGANFLVIALWENDLMARTKTEIILLSLLWSAFTSFMAILTLGFLRSVITIVFEASMPRGIDRNADAMLEEVILHLECRFVVGALVGVCLAWTVTDVLLGMNIQILFSVVTLAVSLLWCKLMMHCFTKEEDKMMLEEASTISCGSEDTAATEVEDERSILLV